MRIAAGVLLIIASIFSACAGFGYVTAGGLASAAGDMSAGLGSMGDAAAGMGDVAVNMAKDSLKAAEATGDAAAIESAKKAVADAEKSAAEAKANNDKAKADLADAAAKATAAGGGLMIFGVFLLVLFGLEIAGAVCLFTQKAAMFVLVVGVLVILGEVWGFVNTGSAGIAFKAFDLVAGVLAILASRSYTKAAAS